MQKNKDNIRQNQAQSKISQHLQHTQAILHSKTNFGMSTIGRNDPFENK